MFQENQKLIFSPTDFVALANQVFERAFGYFYLEGEVSNLRIAKNRWVYFDLKDDNSKVSCFGSLFSLPGPIEEGMKVVSEGRATLHPQYGFNFTFNKVNPSGQGSIKKALDLLRNKLEKEGLFDQVRKRQLVYPPSKIALITSINSAAYSDFMKILQARWPFVLIDVYDSYVQGDNAPDDLINCLNLVNSENDLADVIVMTRGGGSNDDMDAFNDERVVRSVAASRVPTLVAIGHEKDESLSELVCDKRASTPSNAAETICPNLDDELELFRQFESSVKANYLKSLKQARLDNLKTIDQIENRFKNKLQIELSLLEKQKSLINALNPLNILNRGYSLIYDNNSKLIKSVRGIKLSDKLELRLSDGKVDAVVNNISKENR